MKARNKTTFEIEPYGSLCELAIFTINGVDADYEDFGNKYDDEQVAHGCGNMIFEPDLARQEVLDKYNISNDDYNNICAKLVEALSFGRCGWCI